MEDGVCNECWGSSAEEGRRCNSPLSLRDLWEPVASVHSGLREIEGHYLFIFIHPFSQLTPLAFHLGFSSFAQAQPHIYQSLLNSGFAMTFFFFFLGSIYRHPHVGDILKRWSHHPGYKFPLMKFSLKDIDSCNLFKPITVTAVTFQPVCSRTDLSVGAAHSRPSPIASLIVKQITTFTSTASRAAKRRAAPHRLSEESIASPTRRSPTLPHRDVSQQRGATTSSPPQQMLRSFRRADRAESYGF